MYGPPALLGHLDFSTTTHSHEWHYDAYSLEMSLDSSIPRNVCAIFIGILLAEFTFCRNWSLSVSGGWGAPVDGLTVCHHELPNPVAPRFDPVHSGGCRGADTRDSGRMVGEE